MPCCHIAGGGRINEDVTTCDLGQARMLGQQHEEAEVGIERLTGLTEQA